MSHLRHLQYISASPELTFRLESLFEAEQHICKPANIIHQLHDIVWVHPSGAHYMSLEPYAAQRVGVFGAAAHVPGLGGARGQRSCVGVGEVAWRPLGALNHSTTAAALPQHPSGQRCCCQPQAQATLPRVHQAS